MNDMSIEINTREHLNTREVSVREFNSFVDAGLKDVHRTLTRREFLQGALGATTAVLMLATGCSNSEAINIITPEGPTEQAPSPSSGIESVPAPTEEAGFKMVDAKLLKDEDALFQVEPIYKDVFEAFKAEQLEVGDLIDPEFSAFGIAVDTGETKLRSYAFFVVDDSENGGPSFIALPQLALEDNKPVIKSVPLEWMEVDFEGNDFVVLAQTQDVFGNELPSSLAYLAFPHTMDEMDEMLQEDENQTVDTFFSPFGEAISPDTARAREVIGVLAKIVQPEIAEHSETITVDGEEIQVPKEAFIDMNLNGDTVTLKTVQLEAGTVDYFQLENEEWATPIEVQRNPDNPENYTKIEAEDVWSGRLLYSEMLVAEDFPEGTIVPDSFWYTVKGYAVGDVTMLEHYTSNNEELRTYNDFRRWTSYYWVNFDGKRTVLAVEQVLSSDGNSSYFFPYVFGSQWGVVDDNVPDSLIDDVFKMKERGYRDPSFRIFQIINLTSDMCDSEHVSTQIPLAACEYYGDDRNKPVTIREDLQELIDEVWEKGGHDNSQAGSEISELQKKISVGVRFKFYPAEYWSK